jgi:hypothetical protein
VWVCAVCCDLLRSAWVCVGLRAIFSKKSEKFLPENLVFWAFLPKCRIFEKIIFAGFRQKSPSDHHHANGVLW